jgi:hypothetical protein
MTRRILIFTSLITLSACADITEGQIQNLTVRTPGAHDATCYVYVDKLKYKTMPPETISISKSGEDLIVDCLAPGGRERKVFIDAQTSGKVLGNVVTGVVPGTAWDYASKAAYRYPDIVEVDFTNAQIVPEGLPAHNNPDIKQPEEYYLEEFRPSSPRMNEDRFAAPDEIQRRQTKTGFDVESNYIVREPLGPATAMDKGDLIDVINDVGAENIDPAAAPADPAAETSKTGKNYGEGHFRRDIFGHEAAKEAEAAADGTPTSTKKSYTSKFRTNDADSDPVPLTPNN